jgi:IS5 family transposase
LRGKETDVFGDAGYQGADKSEENQGKQLRWRIAMRAGKRKALPETPWGVANLVLLRRWLLAPQGPSAS